LRVVNAGHMGPMIRRSDGRIEVIGEEQLGPVSRQDNRSGFGEC